MNGRIAVAVTIAGLLVPTSPSAAQTLEVGSTAPNLDKVSHWLVGKPIDAASIGSEHVTVIEFWATWCPPCIESIPHLTELQKKYADKKVRIVAVTSHDPGNTLQTVKRFVKTMGDKIGYTVAFDQTGDVADAFMAASGQDGIPTAFIIDRNGKLAWIGSPQLGMEDVIEDIVSGRFDLAKAAKLARIDKRIVAAEQRRDWTAIIDATEEALAVTPADPHRWMTKFFIYQQLLDRPVAAREAAVAALKHAQTQPDTLVEIVSNIVARGDPYGCNGPAMDALATARKADPKHANLRMAGVWAAEQLGRRDQAVQLAAESVPVIKTDPSALSHFADMLLSFGHPSEYADIALQAADAAVSADGDDPRHHLTRFRVLNEAKNNRTAAAEAGRQLIAAAAGDPEILNGFAWGLLTEENTKGRYNDLALAAAEAMSRAPGGDDWSHLDTLALAKFESGSVGEAIDLQKRAVERCANEGMRIMLRESLARYEAARKK